jgi:hypothetical protein
MSHKSQGRLILWMWVSKLFEVDFSNLNEVPWNRALRGFLVYSTSARPISAFRKPPCLTVAHPNTVENFASGIVESEI